jgi:hypothetical protein
MLITKGFISCHKLPIRRLNNLRHYPAQQEGSMTRMSAVFDPATFLRPLTNLMAKLN